MPGGIDVKDYEGSHEVILPYDTRLPVLKWDQQIVAGAIGHLLTVAYDGQGINIEADRILIDKTSEPYVIITEDLCNNHRRSRTVIKTQSKKRA
jgi:hypothetical protein